MINLKKKRILQGAIKSMVPVLYFYMATKTETNLYIYIDHIYDMYVRIKNARSSGWSFERDVCRSK